MFTRIVWTGVGVLWLGVVVTGLAALARYDNRPGAAAAARVEWPADSGFGRETARPTLVFFAHPRCTCSKASLAELAEVIARAKHRPRTYVVFIKPGTFAEGWEQTELWRAASRIPEVTIVRDDDGREAQRFGAETSGQTFLYDGGGQLLFSGGITGARGHAGDNAGRAALLALLNQDRRLDAMTAVFGCALFGDHDRIPSQEGTFDGSDQQ